MSAQPSELERIRQNYNERLDILRQSQVLFNKNKHRSIPNRGPYEYGLKVAREEFEAAKIALRSMLQSTRTSEHLSALRDSANEATAVLENEAVTIEDKIEEEVSRKPKRVFLAKLQQAEALKKELSLH